MYDNLTKDDIKKMQEEIEYRKLVVRKEALEAVKEARAQGDLSENFEYKAAKQDKNRNESRIRYLEKMIKTARIVSDESKSDEVGLGDRVELYIPEDDETESYKLVTTVRGNSMKGLISIDSPLGHCVYHDLTMIIKGCFQIIYYESPGRQPRMSHACMSEFTGIGRASRYEQGAR